MSSNHDTQVDLYIATPPQRISKANFREHFRELAKLNLSLFLGFKGKTFKNNFKKM